MTQKPSELDLIQLENFGAGLLAELEAMQQEIENMRDGLDELYGIIMNCQRPFDAFNEQLKAMIAYLREQK